MLVDLVVVALGTAYCLTAVERFVSASSFRGFLSLGFASLGGVLAGNAGGPAVLVGTGGAFLSLLLMLAGERLAATDPVVVRR